MRPLTFLPPLIILSILAGSLLIAYAFARPETPKVTVTIPEGATVGDINKILHEKGVLTENLPESLEGYLFPDTYEFFVPSTSETVRAKFEENFNRKVEALLLEGLSNEDLKEILIKASLIEKEVPNSFDRKIVSGIMAKRLKNNIPLQMDASLCYEKTAPCLPITREDKASDSPFNTYQNLGLPPQPIANPGVDAVAAALDPALSPYWFYLSDPQTKKTIFSETLDEHNSNIVKYLNITN